MALKNDPRVIARLLRALALGIDHIESKNSIIFLAAAELLDELIARRGETKQ